MYVDFQSFTDGTQISITLSAIRDALHRGVRQKFGECWFVLARLETVERTRSGTVRGQAQIARIPSGWRLHSASSAADA